MKSNTKKGLIISVGTIASILIIVLSIFVGYCISMNTNKVIHENIDYNRLADIEIAIPDECVDKKLFFSRATLRVIKNSMPISKVVKNDVNYINIEYNCNLEQENGEYEIYYGVDSFATNKLTRSQIDNAQTHSVYKDIEIKSYDSKPNEIIYFFETDDAFYEVSFIKGLKDIDFDKVDENLLNLCTNTIDKI